ncbi:Intramembrane protease 2 [Toxocara canis]|uniref:Intramembrane protease 2 n=1 Tax=Toxocara canis TaxID=6265 RepID=A0A0B2UK18_TOXCA|nr:Intramembrane protease 2 [Toxocara canis]
MPSKLMSRLEKIFSLSNSTELSPVVHNQTALFALSNALSYVNKANIMYLLLLLLCLEGCIALATLLKPIFSFFLRRLPIGERQPRLNFPYLWSLKKGKKEMEEGDIEDASNKDTVSYAAYLSEHIEHHYD